VDLRRYAVEVVTHYIADAAAGGVRLATGFSRLGRA
jgi:hypothetical protein